jgi:hypothetical protein
MPWAIVGRGRLTPPKQMAPCSRPDQAIPPDNQSVRPWASLLAGASALTHDAAEGANFIFDGALRLNAASAG